MIESLDLIILALNSHRLAGIAPQITRCQSGEAVRKTISGLVKLIYPNGQLSKQEVDELHELSLEGRRRAQLGGR